MDSFSLPKDELFVHQDEEKIWQKYCGFLDLSLDEFMTIQEILLKEQLDLLVNFELGRKILGGQKPGGIEEFRKNVPFTTYQEYAPYFNGKDETVLLSKPVIWAQTTSGETGVLKMVPYTVEALSKLAENIIAALILSSATRKGEVHVRNGIKVVLNLPPVPYISGIMSFAASHLFDYEAIPPLAESAKMQFEERIKESFKIALSSGIDYACSLAAVLVKVGESFGQMGEKRKLSLPSKHPKAVLRLLKAVIRSRLIKKPVLPKDLWKVKGLVCGGADSSIYRDAIHYYWGVPPLDVYVNTETCFIAMQGWNKKGMTFVPYTNFYEFIPEDEWLKSRADKRYRPATVLLDEVKPGAIYEIVVTNFNGGPFVRYRIGDLIKIIALKDEETGVNLPQMVYQSRADELIDIAGFARLDEKTIWQAIQSVAIPYVDWTARKEYRQGKPVLHIYLELSDNRQCRQDEMERLIEQQLVALDTNYRDFRNMTGAEPLLVTLLSKGAFRNYLENRRAEGHNIARLKPSHINASEEVIKDLLLSNQGS